MSVSGTYTEISPQLESSYFSTRTTPRRRISSCESLLGGTIPYLELADGTSDPSTGDSYRAINEIDSFGEGDVLPDSALIVRHR